MVVTYTLKGQQKRQTFYSQDLLNKYVGMIRKNVDVTNIEIKGAF